MAEHAVDTGVASKKALHYIANGWPNAHKTVIKLPQPLHAPPWESQHVLWLGSSSGCGNFVICGPDGDASSSNFASEVKQALKAAGRKDTQHALNMADALELLGLEPMLRKAAPAAAAAEIEIVYEGEGYVGRWLENRQPARIT